MNQVRMLQELRESSKSTHHTLIVWAGLLGLVAAVLIVVGGLLVFNWMFAPVMPEERRILLLSGILAFGFGFGLICGALVMSGVAQIVLNTAPGEAE